jgi:hypothetical protein
LDEIVLKKKKLDTVSDQIRASLTLMRLTGVPIALRNIVVDRRTIIWNFRCDVLYPQLAHLRCKRGENDVKGEKVRVQMLGSKIYV